MSDSNCLIKDQMNSCVKCSDRFWNNQGKCVSVDTQCKTYDPLNGKCLSCFPGFRCFNGECLIIRIDPFCAQTNQLTGLCNKCSKGYYITSSGCAQTSPQCSKSN